MATIRRSGRPRSNTKTIKPPANSAKATRPDKRDSGLYIFLLKTEAIDAILSAPDAATIKNKANT